MTFVVGEVPKMGRTLRKPQHPFQVRAEPFQIQLFHMAPVLAGETLKNALMQSRVVSDPIKNPLIGWWKEYYFFYVKLTDIDFDKNTGIEPPGGFVGQRVKMLLADPAFDKTSVTNAFSSANPALYAVAGNQRYANDCRDLIVKHYFRDENDVAGSYTIGSIPIAMINNTTALDSAILDSAYVRPDVNVDLNANATITASEVDEALRRYNWLRSNGLTDASYEDYLETFGLNQKEEPAHRPELLRYVREWTYPSNTVEATTGVPSSACSWSFNERIDKARFFKEPGFIVGVTVTRPKVYISPQTGSMIGFLDRAEDWLPAALWDQPLSTMKKYALGTGPYPNQAAAYWIDMRDLFLYGDQWVNFALSATDAGMVALPTSGLQKKFPASTDTDALFVNAAGGKKLIKEDGVVSLTIAGAQRDMTATT